jgi:hypothetical protein
VIGDGSSGISGFDVTQKDVRRPDGARIVFPNVGYKQQLQMATYGAIFARLSSDMTLLNKMRLSVDGDNTPRLPGTREVRFLDPVSGYAYVASKFGDDVLGGVTVDRGIASRMVARANQLLAQAYVVKVDASTGKPVEDDKGQLMPVLGANGELTPTSADAALKLRRYVGLLDATRQISRALDGPLAGVGNGGGGGGD